MLSDADLQILHLIGRMYYLNPEHVRARFYGNSISWVQNRLFRLKQLGYLDRKGWDATFGGGSRPYVYWLASKGRAELIETEYLAPSRFRPSEQEELTQYPKHTLAINEVLIALEKLTGAVTLAYYVHERTIARMVIPYKPDAYIHLSNDAGYLLEVDMGTESPLVWQNKMERLARFVNSDRYDEYFPKFRGVIVVARTDKRLLALRSWTELAFTRMGLPRATDAFVYTTLDVASDPNSLAKLI